MKCKKIIDTISYFFSNKNFIFSKVNFHIESSISREMSVWFLVLSEVDHNFDIF